MQDGRATQKVRRPVSDLPKSNAKTTRTVQTPQDGINKPGHTESKPSDK